LNTAGAMETLAFDVAVLALYNKSHIEVTISIPDKVSKFYQDMHGERWPRLFQALMHVEPQACRWNQFSSPPPEQVISALEAKGEIPRDENGLLRYYVMDPASYWAALALEVQDGDQVLDMCAAPGGKSLVLAEALKTSGELLANEMSEARRDRLKKVIQQYIPRHVRDRVWVTGKDGGKFALTHKQKFDRILVDAPCSGERHLFETPKELEEWKPSRSEKLAQRQYALLTAALLACKPGGRIVYSTCTVSELENDQVIEKLLKKKEGQFRVLETKLPLPGAEKTVYGIRMWPDLCEAGPIYYSVLEVH
jgi:5-methylcytosine rRNA methyltransferase NSUN4